MARSQQIPKWCKTIEPEEFKTNIQWRKIDSSNFKKIHYFGDLQGCFTPLKEYFDKYPIIDDELYIFVGDFIDRGIENKAVVQFLLAHHTKKNFVFIEGNHDRNLWKWSNNEKSFGREFQNCTLPELCEGMDSHSGDKLESFKKEIRILFRSFVQLFYHSFGDKDILVSFRQIFIGLISR
jgi:hypothetical protein